MSDTFESMVTDKPPSESPGSPIFLTAAQAAEVAENAGVKTGQANLLAIVNTRIQRASNDGQRELADPFAGLIRPAAYETKLAVLEQLATAGYRVEAGGDPDQAVIRW